MGDRLRARDRDAGGRAPGRALPWAPQPPLDLDLRPGPDRRPAGHDPLLQQPEGADHRARHPARPGPGRRLRPRRLLGLGGLRHRRLHHRPHRAGAGRPRLRGGQPRLPPRSARALARPDRGREMRHPLSARQRPPLPHRPFRNRGLGSECGRTSRGTPRDGRTNGWLGHRRLPQRVERGAGRGRHGGAERSAHHGGPGRRRAGRRELHFAARRRATTSSWAPT